jgi:hypothetical protein
MVVASPSLFLIVVGTFRAYYNGIVVPGQAMSITCTLLIQMALTTVQGVLPVGARLEFLAPGSPDRQIAKVDDKGAYSIALNIALAAGRFEVTLVTASGKRNTAMVAIPVSGAVINAQPEEKSKTVVSGQEYDLLADWRVVDKARHGVGPVKVALEAELSNGRTEKLSVWALSGFGDEEKETDGAFDTTPDGRVLFRVRESRFRPDRVVALRVKVEAAGRAPFELRLPPVLEFSSSGHFHAVYPEQYEMILP